MSIEIHCILIDLSQETILPHDVIGTGKEVSVSVSVSNHAKSLFQQNVVKSTMDQCSCVSAASANVNASAMIVSQLKIMEMKAAEAAEAVVAYDELDSDEDTDKDTHADANADADTASFYWRCTALGCFRKKRNGISSTNSNSSRRNSRDKRSSSLSTPPATTHDKEQKIGLKTEHEHEHEHISEIIKDESEKEMIESTIQSVSKFLKVHDQFIAFTSVLLKSYLYHMMITSTMTTMMIASSSEASEASSENKNKFKFKTPKQIVILPRTKYGKPYLHIPIPIPKPKPSSLSSPPSSLSSSNIHTKKKNTNGRNKTRLMQKWNHDHGNEEQQALVLKKEESELGLEQKESSSTSTTTTTTITSSQIPFSVSHHYPFIGLAYMNTTKTNTNTNEHSMSKKCTPMKRNMMLGFDIVTFDSYAKTKHLYTSSDEFLNCFRSTFTTWEWSQIKGVVSDADAQMEDEEYNNQYNNGNGNGSIIHNEVVSDPTRVKEMLLRWAMKEAYTKGLGTGLGAEFGSFAIQLHGVDGDSHHWNNNNVNNSRNYGYGHGYGHGNGNGRPSSAGMTIRSESSASLTGTNTNTGGRIFDLIQHAEILGSGSGPGSMKDKKVHLKASIYHKEERNAKFWEFIFLPLTTTTTTTTPGQKSGILGCACICAGPIETTTADPTGVDLSTELKLSSMSMQDLMEYHTGTSTPFASKK